MYILENDETLKDISYSIGKRFIGITHGDWYKHVTTKDDKNDNNTSNSNSNSNNDN